MRSLKVVPVGTESSCWPGLGSGWFPNDGLAVLALVAAGEEGTALGVRMAEVTKVDGLKTADKDVGIKGIAELDTDSTAALEGTTELKSVGVVIAETEFALLVGTAAAERTELRTVGKVSVEGGRDVPSIDDISVEARVEGVDASTGTTVRDAVTTTTD